MGVDSKVFVIADKDQALDVGQAVFDAVEKWQRQEFDSFIKDMHYASKIQYLFSDENKDPTNGSRRWSHGAKIHASAFDCFQIMFDYNCEHRILWYFTDCSGDTDDVTKEHTLLFSIGNWGSSDKIMKVVIDALKPFGPVYYDYNDCDEHDYVLQN